ncbi:MAG TPA: hypothetical protein VGY97_00735, partial [Solirubrobacteraceae bacterium]|nr:hypothetical protein [Solirubrobacteraceae bacterium]
VIVTANEDQHSRLYTVDPDAAPGSQVTAYTYSPDPGASGTGGVHTGGGTDAVSIYNGDIFVSASNPNDGTSAAGPNPSATAVFEVSLDSSTGTAKLSETFADNAPATDGATGQSTTLNLGDPDSNAVVPESSPRFGGDFMLDGQADNQLVFAGPFDSPGNPTLLTTLNLSHGGTPAGVDDVRWAEGSGGTLYVVDNSHNQVLAIAGPFQAGQAFASLDHVGATATTTELDSVDLGSGALTAFASGLGKSKGLLYVPAEAGDQAQSGAKDSGEAAPDSSTGRSEPVATNGGSAGNEPSSTSKPSAKHSVHGTKRSHRRHPRQAHRTRRRHHKPGTARHRA